MVEFYIVSAMVKTTLHQDPVGIRWLESETVKRLGLADSIDRSFYDALVNDAVDSISQYGDFEWFVSDDPYVMNLDTSRIPFK